MLKEYVGREVSTEAMRPVYEALLEAGCAPQSLPSIDDFRSRNARITWQSAVDLLKLLEERYSPAQIKAIGASGLTSSRYRHRSRLARSLLCLEDAFRFMIFPHREIDFGCMQAAVDCTPGEITVTAVLHEGYEPSPAFFLLMLGAAEAMPKVLGYTEAVVSGSQQGHNLDFHVSYQEGEGLVSDTRRMISSLSRRIYCALNFGNAYNALMSRTFAMNELLVSLRTSKRAQREAEEAFNEKLAQTGSLYMEISTSGYLTHIAGDAKRDFGCNPSRLLKEPFAILSPSDRSVLEQYVEAMRLIPEGEFNVKIKRAGEPDLPALCTIRHLRSGNGYALSLHQLAAGQPLPPLEAALTSSVSALSNLSAASARDDYNDAPTIVFADDNTLTCRVGKHILEKAGFAVVCLSDGAQVLEFLEHNQAAGLVLDINMPQMKGDQVYASLRSRKNNLPVVFISGDTSSRAPLDDTVVLDKPFRAEALVQAVQGVVN